jgi:hypothetical protein
MKRFFQALVLFTSILFCVNLYAAGTVTQTRTNLSGDLRVIEMSVTTASNGSLTATETNWDIDGILFMVETDPGTTSPTDEYDLTLTNEQNHDVMGGGLADRSETSTQWVFPQVSSSNACVPVEGKLTLNLSNNSVNSATFVVRIYFFGD